MKKEDVLVEEEVLVESVKNLNSINIEKELIEIEDCVRKTHQSFVKLISKIPPNKRNLKPIKCDWPNGDDLESILKRIKSGSIMTKEYLEQMYINLYGGK